MSLNNFKLCFQVGVRKKTAFLSGEVISVSYCFVYFCCQFKRHWYAVRQKQPLCLHYIAHTITIWTEYIACEKNWLTTTRTSLTKTTLLLTVVVVVVNQFLDPYTVFNVEIFWLIHLWFQYCFGKPWRMWGTISIKHLAQGHTRANIWVQNSPDNTRECTLSDSP